jgi:hypothetical protein
MTVPFLAPFSAGQILTSDDMNETAEAVNSLGLFIVKTQAVGNVAVPSVTVTDAFSSDFDDYLITINTVVSANQPNIGLRLGATASGYAYSGYYQNFGGGALTVDATTTATYLNIGACGNGTGGQGRVSFHATVKSPNLAQQTYYVVNNGSLTWTNFYTGYIDNSTQYTAFTILPSSGTITGGTVRVYGYRNSYS